MADQREALNRALQSEGLEIRAPVPPEYATILTPECLKFLAALHNNFDATRRRLLDMRRQRREELLKTGKPLTFPPETAPIRAAEWRVAPIPADLQDRRVEITGPVTPKKMVINAFNSGASAYMADFEDATTPTWDNNLSGQHNLRDAINGTLQDGSNYKLKTKQGRGWGGLAVLFVRPRGWHLLEKHIVINGVPMSGSLFDFGVFFFHNAATLLAQGTGPYFYLPKMESYLEARLWNDVFVFSQRYVGVPQGSIRATVLIETIQAGYQMDEILWELREHSAGLNCGRWDYIFSFARLFRHDKQYVLPDREQVTMTSHFLASYVALLIHTCHKRGIHAMGGMAAQIPIRSDPKANQAALDKVEADKLREVKAGHDGTWVAHPGLIPVAKGVFDKYMPSPNQIHVVPSAAHITAADLVKVPTGEITERGVRGNIAVALEYVGNWLAGTGCVPINNLMEDAATAEISRTQLWQWVHHGAKLNNGNTVEPRWVSQIVKEETDKLLAKYTEQAKKDAINQASKLVEQMILGEYPDFLTVVAYDHVLHPLAKVPVRASL